MRKVLSVALFVVVALALAVASSSVPARAADHLDAPLVDADGRIDITDVYAFTQGSDTVLIMNVDPLAGVQSPTSFRSTALYEFHIDNTGDAIPDISFRLRFSRLDDGHQTVTLLKATGRAAKSDDGDGRMIARGQTGHTLSVVGGGKLWTGLRDDPFFFDLAAFKKFQSDGNPADFCAPGTNFFAGLNVASIVLQVPTSSLVSSKGPVIYPWGAVSLHTGGDQDGDSNGEDWTQVERMGKPALATVFIKPTGGTNSDAYNATTPDQDLVKWGSFFPANPIPLLGGVPVRNLLLPDTLILNTSGPLVLNNIPFAGYPNGRRLQDDVIDTSFSVLANAGVLPSSVTTDCVANDSNFSSSFPYLAAPNH